MKQQSHLDGNIRTLVEGNSVSDVIVDIVETGTTLKENNLRPYETIVPISARLVSNKVSYKFKNDVIGKIASAIEAYVKEKNND